MQVVIVEDGNVFGPFATTLEAKDFAIEHNEATGLAGKISELMIPVVYGEEGL